MSDVVVTVPKDRWAAWCAEGDCAGDRATGDEWAFYVSRPPRECFAGDRVYIVAHGRLRGYSLLVRMDSRALVRSGGAVALTLPYEIPGFRGCRYRWWHRHEEIPFPDWRIP